VMHVAQLHLSDVEYMRYDHIARIAEDELGNEVG
jgi:hypothetical protein